MPTIFGKLLASTPRFLKIDDQNRGDHSHLTAADECYFLYEYTSRRNYSFSSTNQLISNLKKKPSQASANEFHMCAAALGVRNDPNRPSRRDPRAAADPCAGGHAAAADRKITRPLAMAHASSACAPSA
jgi:hypothetical protein